MKQPLSRIIFILLPVLLSCHTPQKSKTSIQAPVVYKTSNNQEHPLTCNMLTDKKLVFDLANKVNYEDPAKHIWNVIRIDSTDYFTTEDYFTNSTTKDRLVVFGGVTGGVTTTSDHMLLLFSCTDTAKLTWYEETGKITAENIIDVNGDGIKEIIENTSYVFMGSCGARYSIFNYKNGKPNYIYSAQSHALIGCGRRNRDEPFKPGDTLVKSYDCSLQKKNDKASVIKQIKTVKIYQGGKTDKAITQKLKVIVDTTEVLLN